MIARYKPCRCAATETALRERRKYVHVGSRATSLLRSVPQRDPDARTLMESYPGGMVAKV